MTNSNGSEWIEVVRGCPQGFIAGPYMWNLSMNDLLNLLDENVAYADDLVVVMEGDTREGVERKVKERMRVVNDWGNTAGVKVSQEKTVCMLLKSKLDLNGRSILVNEHNKMKYVSEVKYLGVSMSERMNFDVHVLSIRGKVSSTVGCLQRVLRRNNGVKKHVMNTWMVSLFSACALYASSAWYESIVKVKMRDEINRAMRCVMYVSIRVCRTVSTEAMQVLLGWLPRDLECLKRADVYNVKKGLNLSVHDVVNEAEIVNIELNEVIKLIEERVTDRWQSRWMNSSKGRVTMSLLEMLKIVRVFVN